MNAIVLCVIVYVLTVTTDAFSPGDRVSALCRTHHDGFKSPWMDLTLQQMPKFRYPESTIIRTALPMREENGPEMKLNPKEDLKVSLLFAGSKHVLPLILLFDSKQKKSLKTLIVTYKHDDYDIINLKFETIYGPPLARVDASHPAMTAFELVHRWEAVHDNDFRLGIVVMFSSTLLIIILMISYIAYTYDRDSNQSTKSDSRRESQGSMGDSGYIRSR